MKKIGILNFHYSNNNYGAVLQAAALQHFLRSNGYDPVNIDFVPVHGGSPSLLGKVRKFLRPIKKIIVGDNRSSSAGVVNSAVFQQFRARWISTTDMQYSNSQDLNNENWNFDAYIVGSDQVWRSTYTMEFTPEYFFSFLPEGAVKIAYAASFGIDRWDGDEELTTQIKPLVGQFTSVTVREHSGKEICRDTFNVDAEHVLDPTLLVGRDFFEEIIASENIPIQESNIVYYKLDVDKIFNNVLTSLKLLLNRPVENIYFQDVAINGRCVSMFYDVYTWLAKIRNASLVVTDSYHCVCFAILFERPFLYYPNDRGVARIESLFDTLGINRSKIFNLKSNHNPEEFIVRVDESIKSRLVEKQLQSSRSLIKNLVS